MRLSKNICRRVLNDLGWALLVVEGCEGKCDVLE
jgi:hypothetical protein